MSIFQDFLAHLYKYLLGNEDYNNNIIRKHTKHLDKKGEFSFSINTLKSKAPAFVADKFVNRPENGEETTLFCKKTTDWGLQISKCIIQEDTAHIFICRSPTFKCIIQQVLEEGCKYGAPNLKLSSSITIKTDYDNQDVNKLNLSQLRVILLRDVLSRMLRLGDCSGGEEVTLKLSLESNSKLQKHILFCGPVLSASGSKDCTTAEEYLNKRTVHMRLMAQHKYGLRVNSNSGWQEIFQKLGHAAVTIDLLQNKPSHKITINVDDYSCSSSKGASFILYNCTRLATLLKSFENKVEDKLYPPLADINCIDFNLLNESEEWELLYSYVLQFPYIINSCIKDILEGKFNVHNLCDGLSRMCSIFSIYYRRVRILREPRRHLDSELHARVYLLKAVQQVLHNGLYFLNIQPVRQM